MAGPSACVGVSCQHTPVLLRREGQFAIASSTKKEGRGSSPRPVSIGNGRGSAGLRKLLIFGCILCRGLPFGRRSDLVILTQPAAEIDQATAVAAERILWPFGHRAGHRLMAYWAPCFY